MANDNSDLWPADLVVDVVSPIAILNEQAEALAKRTQGIVKCEILPGTVGKFEQLSFDLLAPAVGLRQRILNVRYSKEYPYPAILIAAPLYQRSTNSSADDYVSAREWELSEPEQRLARLAPTPNDVRELRREIFNAPATRGTLFSLIARSNEVTGTVRNGTKQSQSEPSKVEE